MYKLPDWWSPPDVQIQMTQLFLDRYGENRNDYSAPPLPSDFFERFRGFLPLLTTALPKQDGVNSFNRTLSCWYDFLVPADGYIKFCSSKIDFDTCQIMPGTFVQEPCTSQWVGIDFFANIDKATIACQRDSDENLACVEVIIAMAMSPELNKLVGIILPYINLSVCQPVIGDFQQTLFMSASHGDKEWSPQKKIELSTRFLEAKNDYRHFSSPSIVRVS